MRHKHYARNNHQAGLLSVKTWVALSVMGISMAYANTPEQISNQQIQLQQQRQDALSQSLTTSPNVHVQIPTLEQNPIHANARDDLPCFAINEIAYTPLQHNNRVNLQEFAFALTPLTHGKDSVLGQCLNINDIRYDNTIKAPSLKHQLLGSIGGVKE